MKNLLSLATLLLFSLNSHATIQLNFSGQLSPSEAGNFSGQLIFDITNPDNDDFYPAEDGSNAARYLSFTNNIAQSLTINGEAFNFQSQQINIDAINDIEIIDDFFASPDSNETLVPGTYDLVAIWTEGLNNLYSDDDGSLLNGSNFYLFALFASDAFDSIELAGPINPDDIFNLPLPTYFLFGAAYASLNGPNFDVAGAVTSGGIAPVPLPGSIWLFTSALAWFGARTYKRFA
jgi:hypothetical protein